MKWIGRNNNPSVQTRELQQRLQDIYRDDIRVEAISKRIRKLCTELQGPVEKP